MYNFKKEFATPQDFGFGEFLLCILKSKCDKITVLQNIGGRIMEQTFLTDIEIKKFVI